MPLPTCSLTSGLLCICASTLLSILFSEALSHPAGPMEQLGPTLTEFYAPTTNNERKQQLEQGLHAFRTQPNAHLDSLQIITHIVREMENGA